jgi:hypothetical protein
MADDWKDKDRAVLSNIGHGNAMDDCGDRFFENRCCQFVKDGGATAFYDSLIWWFFGFPPAIDNTETKAFY